MTVKTYRRHGCQAKHRTYKTVAKCIWPKATWVHGEGAYARARPLPSIDRDPLQGTGGSGEREGVDRQHGVWRPMQQAPRGRVNRAANPIAARIEPPTMRAPAQLCHTRYRALRPSCFAGSRATVGLGQLAWFALGLGPPPGASVVFAGVQ